jgi:hypothetical protein
MSKYIKIFNILSRLLGSVELIYLFRLKPPKKINFNNGAIYGLYIYCKVIKGNDLITCSREHKVTNNILDLNHCEDYEKFIMDEKGNVFTTLTGSIFLNQYMLIEKDKPYNHNIDCVKVLLKKNNLLRGDVVIVFKLKKKFGLPKNLAYLILLELSKLHLIIKNECTSCSEKILGKYCHICDVCYSCKLFSDKLIFNDEYYCKSCYYGEW